MSFLPNIRIEPRWLIWLVWPLVFWGLLVVGLQAANIRGLSDPGLQVAFFDSLRAVFPLLAGYGAVTVMAAKLWQRSSSGFYPVGPLGFLIVYGLVGVAGSTRSPNGLDAIYWAAIYVSVPVVLLAIAWGGNGLAQVQRIIQVNWLIVSLAVLALFVVAFLYLKLGSVIAHPSDWFECKLSSGAGDMSWHQLTSSNLRPTGVGRYAALAGILALGGIWQRRWRPLWIVLLVSAMILLSTSGARTSMVAFAGASSLVILLYGGKRVLVLGVVAIAILVPVVWGTGVYKTPLDRCFKVNFSSSSSSTEATSSAGTIASSSAGITQKMEATTSSGTTFDFTLTGRTAVWKEGLARLKESPILGYGFNADRLVLGTHMHNAFLHSAFQAGIIGAILFLAALVSGWFLVIRALRRLSTLSTVHKALVIQGAGLLTFFTLRAITESSGAFFGVDWLLLAPFLLYFQLINGRQADVESA